MNDRRERLRRLAITRCRECLALLDRPVTYEQLRAAAREAERIRSELIKTWREAEDACRDEP